MLKSFGCSTEISGAISAMKTTNPTIASPVHDFGLRTRSTSQPGTRSRPRRNVRGAADGRSSATESSEIGSTCDIRVYATGTSARAQPRVEEEVEKVHDQVRDDHADGENDEDRLGERVVVAEHRLLERVAGAGIAEDVLDEDESSDRAREQRGEAVERRQDRVPARVPCHDAPVAQPFCVR